jgi:PAS domain S-box-containing protein
VAPPRDAIPMETPGEVDAQAAGKAPNGNARYRRRHNISLRSRLLLLVVASVLPLICLGIVRETLDYNADRNRVYERLMTIADGMAVSVERDLELRVSALETLALSPALQANDLDQFDKQAEAFLAHQPPGTVMGLADTDLRRLRAYGLPPSLVEPMRQRQSFAAGTQVFDTRRPIVTDMHVGRVTGLSGFSVDVPVVRDGHVVYDLYIRILPTIMADLIGRQQMPTGVLLTVVDTAGVIVARIPDTQHFVGSHIVPDLWNAIRTNAEGLTTAPTLEGVPAVAAYAHVKPFGWAVIAGAPQAVVFGPLQAAIVRVAGLGLILLAAGLLLAVFASRGIMRPIEQLRRLAAHDNQIDHAASAATGLPETDMVARALISAAVERQKVAAELAESEQRFRALFERSPSGTILLDPDTMRVIDCNAVAAGYVGLTVAEFRGCVITSFAQETSHERIREICREVIAGHGASYETRVAGKAGPRDLLIAVAPVQVSGRTLVLINQIDVTDLRRAEAGLRVNEERLELAREGANLGIWDWDIANDSLSWSEHQWYLHGLQPQPGGPSPKVWRQAVHPSDLRRTQQELVTALRSPSCLFASEYSVILPDGSLRRLLGRGQCIRGTDGRAVRMVGINMDVTARYEAEMARDRLIWMLETERSRLSEVIEAIPTGVGIVDAKGRVVLGNALMRRLNGPVIPSMAGAMPGASSAANAGTAPGEWIAYDADGNRLKPEDFPIRRALQRGETTLPGVNFLFRATDGSETWFRVGSVPLRSDQGRANPGLLHVGHADQGPAGQRYTDQGPAGQRYTSQGSASQGHPAERSAGKLGPQDESSQAAQVQEALAIFLDIDAEKRLLTIQQQINAELEQRVRDEMAAREAAQQRAAHAERMHALGQIAGGIAHDFNNVLQAVSGGAAMIERRPEDTERVLRNARMVLDAARRGAAITSRLLAFSRRGDLRAENIDAFGLLADMAEVLTHTLGGSVICDVSVPRGLPPLFADRGQLETVLVNLATNARDAMPSGGSLTLSADHENVPATAPHPSGLAAGSYIRITVSDTGAGMDRTVLARVTEPFFTTKEPGKGTGLGLAMAKGFVEQSGGSLAIESFVGQGTRVSLWLPCATQAASAVAAIDPTAPAVAHKQYVLLVDDDAIVRDILTLSLEESGYTVFPVDSGPAALTWLAANERVDIIVSDLTMPGMDGLKLIRAAQEQRPGLPAVLLTGYAGDGAALAVGGAISGTFSLLRKPVTGTQLVDRINALIASRKQTSSV